MHALFVSVVSLRARHQANSFLVWQSRKSCSYKEILVRNVLPAVKISYPYAEKVIETPVVLLGSLRNHDADDEDNIS